MRALSFAAALFWLIGIGWPDSAYAGFVPSPPAVQQTGNVTLNHVVTWEADGSIQDGGIAASPCSAFGTTAGTCIEGGTGTVGTAPTCTPVLNSFTVVGSAPAVTCTIAKIGNATSGFINFLYVTIGAGAAGNTSIASVAGTSYISGLPTAAAGSGATCPGVISGATDAGLTPYGPGQINSTNFYTPTWSAQTAYVLLTCTYQTAS